MQIKSKKNCGLYIHIPFCVKKCLYCDFLSMRADDAQKEQYIRALLRELESWQPLLRQYRISTVFIGGGTPTCLSPYLLELFTEELLHILSKSEASDIMEFTIEANPGTVLPGHLPVLKRAGINRVSLGLQSAQNQELRALGRIHTYETFLQTYELLRENSFSNINIDLMSDIPLQSMESYENTLQKIISLQPEHISAYSLIVEEGTPFYESWERGELSIPSEEMDRQMYQRTQELLHEAGFHRYEISNYAKKGFECRHNLIYWDAMPYLGVGLGASSYLGGMRFQNTENMQHYLSFYSDVHYRERFPKELEYTDGDCGQVRCAGEDDVFQEITVLNETAKIEEFMFLGLRRMQGISMAEFKRRFGRELWEVYGAVLEKLLKQKLVRVSENNEWIFLTSRGIDVSNIVLAEFLL